MDITQANPLDVTHHTSLDIKHTAPSDATPAISLDIKHNTPLSDKHYKPPYNITRRAKIMLFGSDLSNYETYQAKSDSEKHTLLEKLERECCNYCIEKAQSSDVIASWDDELFVDLYHSICYKLSVNLSSELISNKNFAQSLLDGKIEIADVTRMSSQEICPEKYTEILKKIAASKVVTTTVKTSALYRCRLCKKNECITENLYNRSLDEGVNLSVTCLNCGHRWTA